MTLEQSNRHAEALVKPPPSDVDAPARVPDAAELFEAKTERQRELLDRLQTGVEGMLTSDGWRAYLTVLARFHRYSWVNSLLIQSQMPEATLVNSYDRWKSLKRQVKRGAQGIKIFYPRKRWIGEEDPVTGEERRREVVTGFGIGNVFDVSQTEGEALPKAPDVTENTGTDDRATAVNLKLARFLIDEGLRLESKPLDGHARGYWSPNKNEIAIRATLHVSPFSVGKTRTLLHEAAHYLADHRGQVSASDAETVAEGAAYVALEHFAIPNDQSSFRYIGGWAKDMATLRTNLSEIQKVSNGLITAIEGVADPYADDFGSFDHADPWAAVREHMEHLDGLEDDAPKYDRG